MPLNVRRLYTSVLLIFGFIVMTTAQTMPTVDPAPSPTQAAPQVKVPTAGEIMRERISRAKAFIAVRNYNAAIYELESIRRESNDASVQAVINVLLTNSYLEQGDYKRAQDFLSEAFNAQKTTKPNAAANYFAIAGQIVNGARNRVERYRALGLNVSDRTLPLEAVNDIEKMRETLELVVTQSKEIGKTKVKAPEAMALLEEASNARSMMARDDYDARKWKDEVADTREELANSRSVVLNALNAGETGFPTNNVASNPAPGNITQTVYTQPAPATSNRPSDTLVADNKPTMMMPVKEEPKKEPQPQVQTNNEPRKGLAINKPVSESTVATAAPVPAAGETAIDSSPLEVGSLIAYATRQTQPIYPPAAKTIRATGVVRVEVTVNEAGDVSEVQKASGPSMLQSAAKDAIRKWKFKPFVRDGQPVKATGFVSFNFAL